MLILTRKSGESLYIGHDVKVTIVELKGNQVRVGIAAPANLKIYREEIYRQILEENKQAASSGEGDIEALAAALPGGKGRGSLKKGLMVATRPKAKDKADE